MEYSDNVVKQAKPSKEGTLLNIIREKNEEIQALRNNIRSLEDRLEGFTVDHDKFVSQAIAEARALDADEGDEGDGEQSDSRDVKYPDLH